MRWFNTEAPDYYFGGISADYVCKDIVLTRFDSIGGIFTNTQIMLVIEKVKEYELSIMITTRNDKPILLIYN